MPSAPEFENDSHVQEGRSVGRVARPQKQP